MKKFLFLICLTLIGCLVYAQDIPQNMSYTQIYDFIDELANDGVIEINSGIRPYSRIFIAEKLKEASEKDSLLCKRQRDELKFYFNDYALELDTIPTTKVHATNHKTWDVGLWQPSFHFNNKLFKFRITPILGMHVNASKKGAILNRWYGAEIQATVANHLSIYANYRDHSFSGKYLKNPLTASDARISMAGYFNTLDGVEYKEADYGGDYGDMRGGIKAYCKWGSIGLVKENLAWGESSHSSNIISGRAPSFPMLTLQLKPTRWIELNYIHGWLVSNILDSTNYYIEKAYSDSIEHEYRPSNKFIAANMLTITPIRKLKISVGNSIIYAEQNPQAAYFIPFAFYKAIDHLLTKGTKTENQNSQIFAMISCRNIKHLHLYASIFFDEIKFKRFKISEAEHNPYSYQVGATLTNWPIKNFYLNGEFTRTNAVNYKHSIQGITWQSNDYYLGHYLGDNSQEIYVSMGYRPIRGLNLNLSYTNARHYNDYEYHRRTVGEVIKQKPFNELTWQNDIIKFNATYEIINNCYAIFEIEYNNARGYNLSGKTTIEAENRLTAQEYLDKFTPRFYQGKNVSFLIGLSFGF